MKNENRKGKRKMKKGNVEILKRFNINDKVYTIEAVYIWSYSKNYFVLWKYELKRVIIRCGKEVTQFLARCKDIEDGVKIAYEIEAEKENTRTARKEREKEKAKQKRIIENEIKKENEKRERETFFNVGNYYMDDIMEAYNEYKGYI